jgi:hypothetical protein
VSGLSQETKSKPIWPLVTIFAAALVVVILIWTMMEPGGWPLDFRIMGTIVVLGILSGGADVE